MRRRSQETRIHLLLDNEPLILDLIEWVCCSPRTYDDVMGAWQSSCPRLTIWEDALDARLVCLEQEQVLVTDAGRDLLHRRGRTGASVILRPC